MTKVILDKKKLNLCGILDCITLYIIAHKNNLRKICILANYNELK